MVVRMMVEMVMMTKLEMVMVTDGLYRTLTVASSASLLIVITKPMFLEPETRCCVNKAEAKRICMCVHVCAYVCLCIYVCVPRLKTALQNTVFGNFTHING